MSDNELPDRDTLDGRLEAQRQALFRVAGIVGMVEHVLEDGTESDSIDQNTAADGWMALKTAREMLDGVTGDLDPDRMLREDEESSAITSDQEA